MRQGCRVLQQTLKEQLADGRLRSLDAGKTGIVPLTRTINELVDYAESAVTDAAMQLKEMQIQLKVATAQRQHAEAILFSISGSVRPGAAGQRRGGANVRV
jgi:hypothetical protein